jgi:F0F1-type ATP synthase membrane subunit b/b'
MTSYFDFSFFFLALSICLLSFLFVFQRESKNIPNIPKDLEKKLENFLEDELKKITEEIAKNLNNFVKESTIEYKKEIAVLPGKIEEELSKTTMFSRELQSKLHKKAEEEIVELTNVFLELKNTLVSKSQSMTEKLIEKLSKEAFKIYLQVLDPLNLKTKEVEKELENYKRKKMEEIDHKIYQMVQEISKEVLGKAISLSDHEDLVLEALEKAKEKIF